MEGVLKPIKCTGAVMGFNLLIRSVFPEHHAAPVDHREYTHAPMAPLPMTVTPVSQAVKNAATPPRGFIVSLEAPQITRLDGVSKEKELSQNSGDFSWQ